MKKNLLLVAIVVMLSSCFVLNRNKDVVNKDITAVEDKVNVMDYVKELESKIPPLRYFDEYKSSSRLINKITHSKLELSFDWEKLNAIGNATLTVTPYFYDTDSIVLDAKYFDIKRIAIINNKDTNNLIYSYDSMQIKIKLDKTYTKKDEYQIYISYVAKMSENQYKSFRGDNDFDGLYFVNINHASKPPQIWTQNEPQNASGWFPTIDSPNQRFTADIFITAPARYLTLSNGELYNSLLNKDTTRTDHWKMSMAVAPYLYMIFVGDYEVIKDEWNGKEVNYYYPAGEEEYMRKIFGNTPEMLEYFSQLFDYKYPWNKYSQVVVDKFVSGAMENCTATVFGDFMLNKSSWWYSDLDKELVVAHELAHHWFGNLVTCESWANIFLNESFASYCEYFWTEYKYSKEKADYLLYDEIYTYYNETTDKIVDFYYVYPESMFNTLNYQKGARILHILRNYLGEEAFFLVLQNYLKKYEYNTAEVEDFRMSVEAVCGEDMNWFFNQWFFGSKYPVITIKHNINKDTNIYGVTIEQDIKSQNDQIFYLPIDVAIYFKDRTEFKRIYLSKESQNFSFEYKELPQFIDIDYNRAYIWERSEELSSEELLIIYQKTPNMFSKYIAFTDYYKSVKKDETLSKSILEQSLDSKSYLVRQYGLQNISIASYSNNETLKAKIIYLKDNDSEPENRVLANGIYEKIKNW